jgi:8-amino-7-oxononanoate synthase
MAGLATYCRQKKAQLDQALHRACQVRSPADSSATIVVDGQHYCSFASSDYLGLTMHPQVIDALHQSASMYGFGSGASPLVSGFTQAHADLQQALAAWLGVEACLLFSNGYMANIAVLTALLGRKDQVYLDRANHASIWDAARLSGANIWRFGPGAKPLPRPQDAGGQCLLVSDGVFSMSGALADIGQLRAWASAHDAWLMIDDAHGFGVLGAQGLGSIAEHGFAINEVDIVMGGFGKAFGGFGAFVAGKADLIDWLVQRGRPYIYTTAMPPSFCAAAQASLQVIQGADAARSLVRSLGLSLHSGLQRLGLAGPFYNTPIHPIRVGKSSLALSLAAFLKQRGIWLTAMRPPTVSESHACCRVVLTALHTHQDVDNLLAGVAAWQKSIL